MFATIGNLVKLALTLVVLEAILLLSQGYSLSVPSHVTPESVASMQATKAGHAFSLPTATADAFSSLVSTLTHHS